MGLGTFIAMLPSFTGAAVTVIAPVTLAVGYLKRLPSSSGPG